MYTVPIGQNPTGAVSCILKPRDFYLATNTIVSLDDAYTKEERNI